MKVLITGATGFVGSWVVHFFLKHHPEADLICVVRSPQKLRWLKEYTVHLYPGSLFEASSLEEGLRGVDYVLHIAGVTKALTAQDYYRGNVLTTRNLLKAIYRAAPDVKKIVHISSQAAVGPSPTESPIDETYPPHPITDYGKSKLQSEAVAREWMQRLPITILRPPAVFGPRDMDVYEVFKNVSHGINLKVGQGDQCISLIHVWDLARGIIQAALHPNGIGETYFICNDTPVWWSEMIALIGRIMQRKVRTIAIPYPIAYGVATLLEVVAYLRKQPTILNRQKMAEIKQPYWVISNQKIKQELGFHQQLSLESAIRNTVAWYQTNGYLK